MALAEDLHNASFTYEDVVGGRDIVFNDPFTGLQLDPERVPTSIAAQPHLHAGLNHLARLASERDHRVTIAGAVHGQEAMIDMRQLQGLVAEHDVIFLEHIGHTARHRRIVKEVGQGRTSIPEDFSHEIGEYGVLQLAAISGNRKSVYFADTPGDGTAYESALTEWGNLARTLTATARTKHGEERENYFRAALINIAGSTILREWNMLGVIGNSLHDAERQGHDVDSSLFLVGTAHTNTLPRKLGLLGVSSAAVELTMHNAGASDVIESSEFDFDSAVRDYRARLHN